MDELREMSLLTVISLLGLQVQFKVRKEGTEHYGPCIFCNPKRNKTNFSFDNTGRFHCFSCGEKGRGAIDLTMAYRKCGFKEAVNWLQSVSNRVETPVLTPTPEPRLTNEPFKSSYEKFKVPSLWLKERGLTQETLDYFGVFEYSNPTRKSQYQGRIFIPMLRVSDGACVGYVVRNPNPTQEEPKYLFPKGVHKALEVFGAWQLLSKGQLPLRVCHLVESPFAVMKFHQLGFPAVSCYGWSVSPQQVEILKSLAKGYIFLPDLDKRGEAVRLVLPLLGEQCWVKCPEYPGSDPEHLSLEQIKAL